MFNKNIDFNEKINELKYIWKEYAFNIDGEKNYIDDLEKNSFVSYVELIVIFAKRIFPHLENKERSAQLILDLLFYIASQNKIISTAFPTKNEENKGDYYELDTAISYLANFVLFGDFLTLIGGWNPAFQNYIKGKFSEEDKENVAKLLYENSKRRFEGDINYLYFKFQYMYYLLMTNKEEESVLILKDTAPMALKTPEFDGEEIGFVFDGYAECCHREKEKDLIALCNELRNKKAE